MESCQFSQVSILAEFYLVQAWHFAEEEWPDDHFSLYTFLVEPIDDKTKHTFLQTGVPESTFDELKKGWKQYYWGSMKTYLASGR